MAKAPKTVTFCLVKLTKTKLADPYIIDRGMVAIGDTMIVDSDQADFLVGDGSAEIVEEGVAPPWAQPTPVPSTTGATGSTGATGTTGATGVVRK